MIVHSCTVDDGNGRLSPWDWNWGNTVVIVFYRRPHPDFGPRRMCSRQIYSQQSRIPRRHDCRTDGTVLWEYWLIPSTLSPYLFRRWCTSMRIALSSSTSVKSRSSSRQDIDILGYSNHKHRWRTRTRNAPDHSAPSPSVSERNRRYRSPTVPNRNLTVFSTFPKSRVSWCPLADECSGRRGWVNIRDQRSKIIPGMPMWLLPSTTNTRWTCDTNWRLLRSPKIRFVSYRMPYVTYRIPSQALPSSLATVSATPICVSSNVAVSIIAFFFAVLFTVIVLMLILSRTGGDEKSFKA